MPPSPRGQPDDYQHIMLRGQKLEEQQQKVEELKAAEDYESAILLLREMIRHPEPALKPYQAWAREQLQQLTPGTFR